MTLVDGRAGLSARYAALEVLLVALRLGLTSFGGPVAHLGYFREEYVVRRGWLDEQHFGDLVGLCQFLPGPASSELGIAIGITRAGLPGGLAAWLGFTLPSAVALTLFAVAVRQGHALGAGWLHGLQVVAVAVVAQALWGMARTLAPGRPRASLAIAASIVALLWPTPLAQVLIIAAAGLFGWRLLPAPVALSSFPAPVAPSSFPAPVAPSSFPAPVSSSSSSSSVSSSSSAPMRRWEGRLWERGRPARPGVESGTGEQRSERHAPPDRQFTDPLKLTSRMAASAWVLFFALLIGLPLLRQTVPSQPLALADSFYRAGALVFRGGHVVLPLLQSAVVPTGWVSSDSFVAGYGAAQAAPGPLFTFAAYLGVVEGPRPNGVPGAMIALVAIFLPSFLLVMGTLPLWSALRTRPAVQAALRGVNAAVVGLLIAALYTPVWTSAIARPADVALGLAAFGLLMYWRLPPWLVVILSAGGGAALAAIR